MIMRSTILARHRFRGPQARSPPHNRALRIIASDGNGSDLALEVIGVDRDFRVVEKHSQARFAIQRVSCRTGEWIRR
jgi:hypothetical protein